jgi:hypothetical protein
MSSAIRSGERSPSATKPTSQRSGTPAGRKIPGIPGWVIE